MRNMKYFLSNFFSVFKFFSSAPLVTSPTLAEGRSGEATGLEMISTLMVLMVRRYHYNHHHYYYRYHIGHLDIDLKMLQMRRQWRCRKKPCALIRWYVHCVYCGVLQSAVIQWHLQCNGIVNTLKVDADKCSSAYYDDDDDDESAEKISAVMSICNF